MVSTLGWWFVGAAIAGPVRVEVQLSTDGTFSFDQQQIVVPSGRRVALTFVNGASPESRMVHNTVVLRSAEDEVATFRHLYTSGFDLAAVADDPGVLALGRPLGPGETETLSVRFPGPGTYPFVCLMPGHGDMMGMRGTIVVGREGAKEAERRPASTRVAASP